LAKSRKNKKQKAQDAGVKASLLKELHHRVKNNLQLMDSLVKLQIATATDSGAQKALIATQRRLHALGISNILLLDRQEGGELELFSLLQGLTEELINSNGPSSLDMCIMLTGEHADVEANCIVPLGMITGEIIANTFDHARPRANRVQMEISWIVGNDGDISITYCDDGGGYPEEVLERLHESLGLMLVRTLAEQIHATIFVANSEKGAVTTVSLSSIA
jgi:two-component sensor histidine kinase